jgi:hypothetical protein
MICYCSNVSFRITTVGFLLELGINSLSETENESHLELSLTYCCVLQMNKTMLKLGIESCFYILELYNSSCIEVLMLDERSP